jgi:hypothetical protein
MYEAVSSCKALLVSVMPMDSIFNFIARISASNKGWDFLKARYKEAIAVSSGAISSRESNMCLSEAISCKA